MTLLIRSCSGPDARLNREEHDEDERKDRTADPAHAMAGRFPRDQKRRFSAASVVQAAAGGKQRGQRSMRGGVMMVVVAPSIFFRVLRGSISCLSASATGGRRNPQVIHRVIVSRMHRRSV